MHLFICKLVCIFVYFQLYLLRTLIVCQCLLFCSKSHVFEITLWHREIWQNLHFWVNYLMLSLEPETHSQFSYWLFHVCVCLMKTCSLYSYFFKYIVWKVFLLFQSPKIEWHLNVFKKTLIINVPPLRNSDRRQINRKQKFKNSIDIIFHPRHLSKPSISLFLPLVFYHILFFSLPCIICFCSPSPLD